MIDDDEEKEGIDTEKIRWALLALFLVGVIVLTGNLIYTQYQIHPYKKICENNPRLRYAQSCEDLQDCINTCAKRQYEEAKK